MLRVSYSYAQIRHVTNMQRPGVANGGKKVCIFRMLMKSRDRREVCTDRDKREILLRDRSVD